MKKMVYVAVVILLVGVTLSLTGCIHFPWHGIGHFGH